MKPSTVLALVMVLCAFLSPTVLGHAKTDFVTLYNGDRVTGEIKSLYAGRPKHSTDSMGTVVIEWQEISMVESRFHYEVRTSEGQACSARSAAVIAPACCGLHRRRPRGAGVVAGC